MVLKRSLKLETARILKVMNGDNFIQSIVMEDRTGKALAFWYCAPLVEKEFFTKTLAIMMKEHDLQLLTGDFNARQPSWCRKHDVKKRGTRSREAVRDTPGYRIVAPTDPTFQAKHNRNKGVYGSSTIDLIVTKEKVKGVRRLEGKLSEGSDHYPVLFKAEVEIDRAEVRRRITKTLLQSETRRAAAGAVYKVSLKEAGKTYEELHEESTVEATNSQIHTTHEQALSDIKEPWEAQVKQRRRKSWAHVNGELLRLWERKLKLYERWRWRPTPQNKNQYKDACRRAKRRERQLCKEQERRVRQHIQVDPENEIAKALRNSAQRRQT